MRRLNEFLKWFFWGDATLGHRVEILEAQNRNMRTELYRLKFPPKIKKGKQFKYCDHTHIVLGDGEVITTFLGGAYGYKYKVFNGCDIVFIEESELLEMMKNKKKK